MKYTFILLIVWFGSTVCAQKTEFGYSLEAGVAYTGKDKSIAFYHETQSTPYPAHLIRPHSVWNTKQVMFNVYPKWVDGLSLSFGFRMFTYGWEIDTVSKDFNIISYNPFTSSWITAHARREEKFGCLTPTLGLGYEFDLSSAFSIKPSISFGLFRVLQKFTQHSYAYDPIYEDYFVKEDAGRRDGYYPVSVKMDVFDLQISTHIVYTIQGLSIYCGPSYFYQKSDFVKYSGLQVNGGISYRFQRKAD